MKHLLILNDPPYGTERSFNGLRMAYALSKNDPGGEVTVFLIADAVACAKNGQKRPGGGGYLKCMVGRVILATERVLMCRTCIDTRGLALEGLLDGATHPTMDELADVTLAADKVLVF